MTNATASLVGALLAVSLSAAPSAAQNSCRPADQKSARMVQWVKSIATGTGGNAAELRASTKIPQVSANQVVYVTSKTVCSKTLSPYNVETPLKDTASGATIQPSGQVYVVQAGTVFVVWDPVKSAGAYAMYVTLSSKYAVLWSGIS